VPLFEAKMLDLFDHRAASYAARGDERGFRVLPETSNEEHENPAFVVEPFYWVSDLEVDARLVGRWDRGWLLGFKDVSSPITDRSFIATTFPKVGVGNSMPLLLPSKTLKPQLIATLCANLSCLPFDYVARQKIGGLHFNYFITKQLPVLAPPAFSEEAQSFIINRVLELIYTAHDMRPFAQDLGYEGPRSSGTLTDVRCSRRN
jgi:hypothetical protein